MSFIAKRFEPDVNVLKRNLLHWFRFDHLRPEQGIALLIGLDADDVYVNAVADWGKDKRQDEGMLSFGISLLNGDEITSNPKGDNEDESGSEFCPLDQVDEFRKEAQSRFTLFRTKHRRLLEYWNSGKHPECTPPLYFVKWALSKSYRPDWLDCAIELDLYKPKLEAEKIAQSESKVNTVVDMAIQQDWDKTKLQDYLLYDLWYPQSAWWVLTGYEYCTPSLRNQTIKFIFALDPDLKLKSDVDLDAKAKFTLMKKNLDRLHELWTYGQNDNVPRPPAYFIEWALSKRFRPNWLDWAIERGLYTQHQEAENPALDEAWQPVNSKPQPAKWRKAFEYESDGLNALYDLIERHYFDADGKPIYDPAQLPLKKNLESEWLTGRTKDEADTIITSGNRKGKADK
jgi:hypothetical protein